MEKELKNHLWKQSAKINEIPVVKKVYNTFSRAPRDTSSTSGSSLFSNGSINKQVEQIKLD